jgi:Alpha/beta hydrolase domain
VPQLGTLLPAGDVINTAFGDLVKWIQDGTPPPTAPYIQTTSIGSPAPAPAVLARDSLGLAIGGIQLPDVSVPTYLNVGTNSGPAGSACVRWGYHLPFSVDELNEIYSSYSQYVSLVVEAANDNVAKGFIQPADAQQIIYEAIQSGVGSPTQQQKQEALQIYLSQ